MKPTPKKHTTTQSKFEALIPLLPPSHNLVPTQGPPKKAHTRRTHTLLPLEKKPKETKTHMKSSNK
jgi:hypothetical protein